MNNYGTGIGLYTSSKICQLIGPNNGIFINSVYEVGSKFSFIFYLNNNDDCIDKEI